MKIKIIAAAFLALIIVFMSQGLYGVSPNLIIIEGGTFIMGSDEAGEREQPAHTVTVSSFLMSESEVTQNMWNEVMDDNPSRLKGESLPVERITWMMAIEFCNGLSLKEGLEPFYIITDEGVQADWSKNGYRLPTEAEWEFAAKGGNKSQGLQFAGSDTIDEVAWHKENSRFKTHNVKEKKANELGLYDMSGNVYEWCWDWFGETYYADSPAQDPKGPETGERKILRGGCWYSEARHSVIVARVHADPDGQGANVGFRVCRNLP